MPPCASSNSPPISSPEETESPTGVPPGNLFFAPYGGVVLIPQSLQPADVVRLPVINEGDSMDLGRFVDSRRQSFIVNATSSTSNKPPPKPKVVMDPSRHIVMFRSKVVSRHHCRILRQNSRYMIKDTKSSSGTFINGRRLSVIGEESPLWEISDGDLLQLGEDYDQKGVIHECLRFKIAICPPKTGTSPPISNTKLPTSPQHDVVEPSEPETVQIHCPNNQSLEQEYAETWSRLVPIAPSSFIQSLIHQPYTCDSRVEILGEECSELPAQLYNEQEGELSSMLGGMDWTILSSTANMEASKVMQELLTLAERSDPRLETLYASLANWDVQAFQIAAVKLIQNILCTNSKIPSTNDKQFIE